MPRGALPCVNRNQVAKLWKNTIHITILIARSDPSLIMVTVSKVTTFVLETTLFRSRFQNGSQRLQRLIPRFPVKFAKSTSARVEVIAGRWEADRREILSKSDLK